MSEPGLNNFSSPAELQNAAAQLVDRFAYEPWKSKLSFHVHRITLDHKLEIAGLHLCNDIFTPPETTLPWNKIQFFFL